MYRIQEYNSELFKTLASSQRKTNIDIPGGIVSDISLLSDKLSYKEPVNKGLKL